MLSQLNSDRKIRRFESKIPNGIRPFDLVDTEQHFVLEVSNVSLERRCS